MRPLLMIALFALLAAGGVVWGRERGRHAAGGTDAAAAAAAGRRWAAFEITALAGERAAAGGPWLEFLARPALRTGLYELAAGERDPQGPHREDEVYHVVAGRAVLAVDGDEVPVGPGSVVYVAAGVDHRFHSITEDLRVLVFFARGG